MNALWSFVGVFVLVLANGFFVAAEFALVTVRRTRIDQLAAEGIGAARHVKSAISDLDRYIAGTQVGITIASLALGWVGEPAIVKLLEPIFVRYLPSATQGMEHGIAIAVAFTLITFLHVILGELVPKSIALSHPESTSLQVARPLKAAVFFFKPLIWSLNGLGQALLRAIGLPAAHEHGSVHSPTELLLLIRQSHDAGQIDSFERSMLQRTFRFSETTVGEIMTPRFRMNALDIDLPQKDLLDTAAASRYTRLPVYRTNIDQMIGVLYTHELFQLTRQPDSKQNVHELVRPLLCVPESSHLDALINKFREERTQIAAVIDEYGGTAGIITLEDVVETVFGEIQDSNEDPTAEVELLADGTIMLRGDARLQDINEFLGWSLQDEDSTTIAGYIMAGIGRLPELGDKLQGADGYFEVIEMTKHRIKRIKFTKRLSTDA